MVNLLLDHVLVEHLIVELQGLRRNQVVVQTFSDRFDDVSLFKCRILLALAGRLNELLLESEPMLESIIHVVYQPSGRRALILVNALVIEFLQHFIEDIPIEPSPLVLELPQDLFKLLEHLGGAFVPGRIHVL